MLICLVKHRKMRKDNRIWLDIENHTIFPFRIRLFLLLFLPCLSTPIHNISSPAGFSGLLVCTWKLSLCCLSFTWFRMPRSKSLSKSQRTIFYTFYVRRSNIFRIVGTFFRWSNRLPPIMCLRSVSRGSCHALIGSFRLVVDENWVRVMVSS